MLGYRITMEFGASGVKDLCDRTFETLSDCSQYVEENYPEYTDYYGIDICEDDGEIIDVVETLKKPKVFWIED